MQENFIFSQQPLQLTLEEGKSLQKQHNNNVLYPVLDK